MSDRIDPGRPVMNAASASKLVVCLALLGLGVCFYDAVLLGWALSVYVGWAGAMLFRVSASRRLSIRILLTWVGIMLATMICTSDSIANMATGPFSILQFCAASWLVSVLALTVVEFSELILVLGYCWVTRRFLAELSVE